jgi:hypothetical protein
MKLKLTSLAALLVALPFSSTFAAVDPGKVPQESKWVVYADFAKMRDSALGRELLAGIDEQSIMGAGENGAIMPDFAAIMMTVGRITAFGDQLTENPEEMNGAMIIEGTDKLRTIADGVISHFLLSNPEMIEELKDLPFEAYRISGELVVGMPDEPILIASRSVERLVASLDVYRGKGGSLKDGEGALTPMLPPGDAYYLYGASVVPSPEMEDGNSPQARILKMTQAASVRIGEADGNAVANAMLVADSDDTASRLGKIVNGMAALLSLAQTTEADLVKFIESVKVSQMDKTVTLQMAYPTEALIELAQANLQREERAQEKKETQRDAAFSMPGELLAKWKADQDISGPQTTADNLVSHSAGVTNLETGAIITVGSRINGNEGARFDYIELVPVSGDGVAQRHEAEFMRLDNYRIEKTEHASGGELVVAKDSRRGIGRAKMRFAGPAGEYRIDVHYVDENDGQAEFKVSVQQPESE